MWLPSEESEKYTAQFRYVEFAHYKLDTKTNKPKVSRLLQQDGSPQLVHWNELPQLSEQYENIGIYTSVVNYNGKDLSKSLGLASLCFDMDYEEDLNQTYKDVMCLYTYLLQYIPDDAINIFFSGGKGFHIECEAIALGVSTSDNLMNVFGFMANRLKQDLDLQSLDLAVYDQRRMWRLVNTEHQKTGLFKVECKELLKNGESIAEIQEHAQRPQAFDVKEQVFDFKANQWYREFVYDYELDLIPKKPSKDMLSRFLEQGLNTIKYDNERYFDKTRLLSNCSAVRNLDIKARTEKHLDHNERLFLCSLLTYTEEAIAYLHELLSELNDYRFEVSNAHIEDWMRRREKGIGGRPYSCDKARMNGIHCADCGNLEPRKKVVSLGDGKFVETDEYSLTSPIRFAYSSRSHYHANAGKW